MGPSDSNSVHATLAHQRGGSPKPMPDAYLAAVVHLDMVGYSMLMGLDEIGTLAQLQDVFGGLLQPLAAQNSGRVVNTAGDSALVIFPGAALAMRFALEFQQSMATRKARGPAGQVVQFRVGMTIADVLANGADVHGEGVNIAARLQAAYPPGMVCVSRALRDQVGDRVDAAYQSLGMLALKNIARPVEAYVVRPTRRGTARRWQWTGRRRQRFAQGIRWRALATLVLLTGGLAGWTALRFAPPLPNVQAAAMELPDLSMKRAPRLSLVTLPFVNTSGDSGQDYLADAVTDDLTTDLARLDGAFVIGRSSAQTYRTRTVDARQVGTELGVRYLVQGSVRRIDAELIRVNAQLVSTDTGQSLWSERFDQEVHALSDGQGDIVRRLAIALGTRLVDAEGVRSVREHAGAPDAFDLVLRARSLLIRGVDQARSVEARALYEQALTQDPQSVSAMVGLATRLIEDDVLTRPEPTRSLERAEKLLAAAEALQPDRLDVIQLHAFIQRARGQCEEAIVGYQRVIDADPNAVELYALLAVCHLKLGRPEAALPLLRTAIRRNPRDPMVWERYGIMGQALLRLERPAEAVPWLRRALDANPARGELPAGVVHLCLVSALAHAGQVEAARQEVPETMRLWPHLTARVYASQQGPPSFVSQNSYVSQGLRLAGVRDHVDEDSDSGVPSQGDLHPGLRGITPMLVPGASTIRTDALRRLLAEEHPLVLDLGAFGPSLPGAMMIGDNFAGGSFDDAKQDRLRRKMQALTGGDLALPIVTLSWNAERWGPPNLALRLVTLGYTHVYWYRGGREVWEAHNLPETDASRAEW